MEPDYESSDALAALELDLVVARFDREHEATIGSLRDRVLVGVDDIPSRWAVQAAEPTKIDEENFAAAPGKERRLLKVRPGTNPIR